MDYEILLKYTKNACTDTEKEEVDHWLASQDAETTSSSLWQLWDKSVTAANGEAMEESLQLLLQRIEIFEQRTAKKRQLHTLYITLYRIAGMLVLPLLASWLTWHYMSPDIQPEIVVQNIEYSTQVGERKTILLEDSTKVYLNSGSILITPDKFTGNKRNVILLGEAYFEVAKNKNKPFIVTTHLMDIEALGTEFCISAFHNDNSVRTTLTEGSVRVSPTQDDAILSVILKPNEQAYYTQGMDNIQVEQVHTSIYTSWINGEFIFEDAPFAEVTKRLETQYGVTIQYNKKQFTKDKINAKFIYHESLDDILRMLSKVAYFQYSQKGSVYYLSKKP